MAPSANTHGYPDDHSDSIDVVLVEGQIPTTRHLLVNTICTTLVNQGCGN